jgi:NAD(P)-dependent dehydrogenase (short-subunit alcohol dehydrogenase family)
MIRFDDRVAIVTGAGTGLGRAHALGLAARGAKLVINDLGVSRDGTGASSEAADAVVAEIKAMGGDAMAHGCDVSDEDGVKDMVGQTIDRWGRVDICVNNAGILRDKTFAKMEMSDFRKVVDVHLIGSANVAHACWPHMRAQKYGRIVFTASGSGLYGNFGQSNYGAATRMTEELLPAEAAALLAPETITPGLLYLVSEDAPSRFIMGAGAGSFAQTRVYETKGITLMEGDNTPEAIAARVADISDPQGQEELPDAFSQTKKYALTAAQARGLGLDW